jgi:hypothetical protein
MASVILVVIVGVLGVFVLLYGRYGPHDNVFSRPVLSVRGNRVRFFPKREDLDDRPEPMTPVLRVVAGVSAVVIAGVLIFLIR